MAQQYFTNHTNGLLASRLVEGSKPEAFRYPPSQGYGNIVVNGAVRCMIIPYINYVRLILSADLASVPTDLAAGVRYEPKHGCQINITTSTLDQGIALIDWAYGLGRPLRGTKDKMTATAPAALESQSASPMPRRNSSPAPPPKAPTSPAQDRTDAAVVQAVARALGEWEAATGRVASSKPLREVIWFYWHGPRLPKPRVAGKYSHALPWTPAARAAWAAGGRPQLVLDHVVPLGIVMRTLITESGRTIDRTIALLTHELDCVVLTKAEDNLMTSFGVRDAMPAGWAVGDDRWARYRAADLDPETFAPLTG
jgi:hypothetical protein